MEQVKQDIRIYFRDGTISDYLSVIGYQLGSGFLGVMTGNGVTEIFPQDLIKQVTLTDKE